MRVQTAAEQLLFSTLRIETDRSVGTGSIVQHKWSGDRVGIFLVTNRHVIADSVRGRVTFTLNDTSQDGPTPLLGQTISVDIPESSWQPWVSHPSPEIDVAVLPLVPLLNELKQAGQSIFFKPIPTTYIPEQAALDELDAVEEVLFLGYPNGIYDRLNNLPIARRGITATPPGVDYEGKPSFLIDGSVFPGSSGSPVFIYNVGGWSSRHGMSIGQRLLFLGILAAVLYRKVDGSLDFHEIPTATIPVITTREMIDLGVVFKARTIVETIEHLLREAGQL